jgi:hypothetical protein
MDFPFDSRAFADSGRHRLSPQSNCNVLRLDHSAPLLLSAAAWAAEPVPPNGRA